MEQRLAERFQAALADEPPLGFDPDEVADLAVSRQRRRGAVLGAATGTVALAIAAVALAGSSAGQAGEPAVVASQPQVSTTSMTSATSAPSPLGDVDALVKKLEEVVPQVIGEHATSAGIDVVLKGNGGWRTSGQNGVLGAVMVLSTPDHYIAVGVMDESTQKIENYDALGAPVSDTTNSDGSHTRVYRYADPEGVQRTHAIRTQSNGVVISASADPAVGLSEDMLVAIVNDPKLKF